MRYALLLLLAPALAFADELCSSTCFDADDLTNCLAACNNRNAASAPREPEPQPFVLPSQHRCTMPLYVNGVQVSQFESDECEDE